VGDHAVRIGTVEALASLAATGRIACMRGQMEMLAGGIPGLSLSAKQLCAWSNVAADLLRLAAHEVAAGRAGRATLALAAAAQELANTVWLLIQMWTAEVGKALPGLSAPSKAEAANRQTMLDATVHLTLCAHMVRARQRRLEAAVSSLLAPVTAAAVPPAAAGAAAAATGVAPSHEKVAPGYTAAAVTGAGDVQQQQQQRVEEGSRQERYKQGRGSGGPDDPVDNDMCFAVMALSALTSSVTADCDGDDQLQLAGCSLPLCAKSLTACSAAAAVAGRRRLRCGGCGLARYCCPEHQKEDWPRHSRLCRRLAKHAAVSGP
jgi:hypothetical protein